MARCKFRTKDGWECPLEAEPGEDYCYWHKKEDGKRPTNEQLEVLEKERIIGVYLRKTNLRESDLGMVHLQEADLVGAKLEGVYLWGVNLKKAKMMGAHLEGANLEMAQLQGANLSWAKLQEASLREANLRKVNLKMAHLKGAYFKETNLQEADLSRANLQGANLGWANLQEANFEEADLEEAYLKEANIEDANLKEANLEGANLENANLKGAILVRANLREANLKNSHIEGAYLNEANLEGANLEKAHLEGANLLGINLSGTNLQGAHLEGANLAGAKSDGKTDFYFTYLDYSNLSFSLVDEAKTLRNAFFDSKTEINEIVADLLRKKNSKTVVLDATKIKKDHLGVYEFLRREGFLKYGTIILDEILFDGILFFDREKDCFINHSRNNYIKIENTHEAEIKEIAENLDKYLLQNPPEGHTEDPEKYKKDLILLLYEASYEVFNMLYYFYIQNGKLDEALEMHRRRSDVRRKILMVKGGWNRVRAIFYDWFILKSLTGYGLNVLKPILFSLITIITFAFLFWITGGIVKIINGIPYKPDFLDYLYHSVITFTSLGYSNIVPNLEIGHLAQFLVAAESIFGVLLIALIIFTITYRISK